MIPWAAVAWVLGNYKMAIGIVILYLVITVIRNSVEPRIVGKQIGIHPLAALIAMFIGMRLFSVIGLPVTLSILRSLKKSGDLNLFYEKMYNSPVTI